MQTKIYLERTESKWRGGGQEIKELVANEENEEIFGYDGRRLGVRLRN